MKSFVPRSFFSALFAAALALGSASSASAATETIGGVTYTYSIEDGGAVLGDGIHAVITNTTAGALTIPATLGGKPVKVIQLWAFNSCSLLTSVTIPASVTTIKEHAFRNCHALAGITVAAGNPSFKVVDGILYNMAQTLLLVCPDKLGKTSFTVPATVERIATAAFEGCSALASVTIGANVKSIGNYAFDGTAMRAAFDTSAQPFFVVGNWVCGYRSSLTGAQTLPAETRGIADYALYSCSALTSLVIPDSVTYIGQRSLAYCSGLTIVTLGSGLKTIGGDTFFHCSKLASLTIPSSVESIGHGAFDSTAMRVAFAASTQPFFVVDGWVCDYRSSLTGAQTLPAGTRGIAERALASVGNLTSLTIPASVAHIGASAFADCPKLLAVNFQGNAPTAGGGIYQGTPAVTNFVAVGSTGWNGVAGSSTLPAVWPVGDADARPVLTMILSDVTVAFDGNGGTPSFASKSYKVGSSYGTLPTATFAGHTFLDWFTAAEGGTRVTAASTVAASVTRLYAHWQISLGRALDNAALTFTTGGDTAWFGQSDTFHSGGGAAQSGPLEDGQTNWLQTTVTGPGQIKFQWRTSSETNYDFLKFSVNGREIGRLSGELSAWTPVSHNVTAGDWTLRWAYGKDGDLFSGFGSDCGWVDEIVWQPLIWFEANKGTSSLSSWFYTAGEAYDDLPYAVRTGHKFMGWYAENGARVAATSTVPIASTTLTARWGLDVPLDAVLGYPDDESAANLTFTTGGDSGWYAQDDMKFDADGAAQSGGIGDSQTSWLQTTVTGPGSLVFFWQVSSESKFDKLAFTIDGSGTNSISGPTFFAPCSVTVPAGTHTLQWTYSKDDGVSKDSDCGWVDRVVWRPQTILVAIHSGDDVPVWSRYYTVGSTYGDTLPELARKGYSFDGWYTAASGGTRVTASSSVSARVTALYAHWTALELLASTDPVSTSGTLADKGAFDGFFYGTEAVGTAMVTTVKGLLNVKVATSKTGGTVAAKATFANARLTFKSKTWGTADANGTYTVTMTAASGEALTLSFRENRVQGALTAGSKVTDSCLCEGARNRFKAEPASAFAGTYTAGLPATLTVLTGTVDVAPYGSGFLSVKVSANGKAKAVGALPDGTKVSCSTTLLDFDTGNGEMAVPVFAPLYSKKGVSSALLWIRTDGTVFVESQAGWNGFWSRPGRGEDGFMVRLAPEGRRLDTGAVPGTLAFATTGAPELWINGAAFAAEGSALPDGLPVGFSGGRFTVATATSPKKSGGAYAYNGPTDAGLKLTLTASTGLVKGSYNLYYDSGKTHKKVNVKVQGVLLPSGVAGFGLVPETDPARKAYSKKRSIGVVAE